MITTLNRKQLEKQRVHIGHFFYKVNATARFGNHLTVPIFRFKKIFTGLTDKLTDRQNQLLNPFTHACAG